MVEHRHITHCAIDLRGCATGSGLALGGQCCLRRLTQNTLPRGQEDHTREILPNRLHTFATEPLNLKDILEPIMIGFMLPAPALDSFEFYRRVAPRIEQVGAEHFPVPTREEYFQQPHPQR